MARKKRALHPDAPLLHPDHPRPRTRREFLSQGLVAGVGTAIGPTLFSLFANPRQAMADLGPELAACGLNQPGAGMIPFICFDLGGGANMAGSNVLVGKQGGQLDFLSTEGYSKMGLPGDMIPPVVNPATGTNDFINTDLGLAFHSDSQFLRGILEKISPATAANINGAIIPARSENDTQNNPHNPMYGIFRTGADGELLSLIGSQNSVSGGRSMAPMALIDPAATPTKVDRTSDVTGLVDTGKLVGLLSQDDASAVMESIYRISDLKLGRVDTKVAADQVIKDAVGCGYVKAADITARFGDPAALNPELDDFILGQMDPNAGIFSRQEFDDEREFRKTAAIMKLVVNGFAGAGTIAMGGYDYHRGERGTGEIRDLRAGRCMGACLEYAARIGVPLMMYVFSDGSVASNGRIDDTPEGRGKGEWTSDNQSTAASFFLVYDPNGRPALMDTGGGPEVHQQIGHFRADGSVETSSTPAANNVNLLVETVALNYLALHGRQGEFASLFPNHGLGNAALQDSLTAFQPIVSGSLA